MSSFGNCSICGYRYEDTGMTQCKCVKVCHVGEPTDGFQSFDSSYFEAKPLLYIPAQSLRCKKLHPDAILPVKAHKTDAGYDLFALGCGQIDAGGVLKIPTGIAIAIPAGYVGIISDRSGVGSKGIKVMGGVVDHGYTGDITVCLANINGRNYSHAINKGDKIAQIVIMPIFQGEVVEVDELDDSARGDKGFGSTGV